MNATAAADCADPALYRRSVARFATGVAVIGCFDDLDHPHGMTVSSFTSISLEPPTVLVSLKPGRMHATVLRRGAYGVSVLAAGHERWSQHFGGKPQPGLRPDWRIAGRVPVLTDALAWFECEVTSVVVVGDHTLFVARVTSCGGGDGQPLLVFASDYRCVAGPDAAAAC